MADILAKEFGSPLWALWTIPLSAVIMVLGTVTYTRIVGLRSFSKMSSFDFAVTIAIGSVMGGVILTTASGYSVVNGMVALGSLYGVQALIALGRRHFDAVGNAVDNTPLLLVSGSTFLDDNLRSARITNDDVYAKLREANVLNMEQLRAVILESTGDISVMHGDAEIDLDILGGVRDVEKMPRGNRTT